MKAIVLCGGRGTRAYPHTLEVPKPLLEVAGRPVLRHVLEIYASQGFTDFVLAAGFKQEMIRDFAGGLPETWQVEVVDTGLDTNTGGRVAHCRHLVEGDTLVTYADGLGNVDLAALTTFHRSHGGTATVTTVPLRSQYGTVECDATGRVERFLEKPVLADRWINAGFFVFGPRALEQWAGDDLERDELPALCARQELYAYRHTGFWKSMDTYKDALELTSLCVEGGGPWLTPAAT